MDMDDDDAFLYGEQSPTPAVPEKTEDAPTKDSTPTTNLSASMAASLAAYGIDPTTAVAEEPLEDGGVEEEDEDDSDDDSDDDDIKLVMTSGPQRILDLRKPQPQQTSNVIGIGKWAHTATANAPPAASPSAQKTAPKSAPAPDALTDYTPAPRPGVAPTTPAQPTTASQSAPGADNALAMQPAPGNGPPPITALPHSTLPLQTAPGTDPKVDPTHPTGIIPSTGTSVYDVDVAQFEGSGQMWRRPGSDISDWFNYGFDEVTYPKFLRYRQEMEQGRLALANMAPMSNLTPEVANMLHLPSGPNPQMQQMQMQQQMQQMQQQMMNMGGMDPSVMFAMQNQGMPGMGMMGGMMQQGNDVPGEEEGAVTPDTNGNAPEGNAQPQQQNASTRMPTGPAARGGVAAGRGMTMPLRGRGGAPLGPRGAAAAANIPKGPKAGRFKDKDRVNETTAAAASTSLDYGDMGSAPASRDASRSPSEYRPRERERHGDRESDRYGDRESDRYGEREERDRYGDRERDRGRDRDRDRERDTRSSTRRDHDEEGEYEERGGDRGGDRGGERGGDRGGDRYAERESDRYGDRENDRYGDRETRRSSRRGHDSGAATPSGGGGLGPDGWESGEEDAKRRRKRERSVEEEAPRRSTRAKRR